jgi:rhodanese-related sulfurtransferase
MTKITTDVVRHRLENNEQMTIVDSRSAHAWDEAETKAGGALRVPPDAAEEHIADLSRDDYIVIYCT